MPCFWDADDCWLGHYVGRNGKWSEDLTQRRESLEWLVEMACESENIVEISKVLFEWHSRELEYLLEQNTNTKEFIENDSR